MEDVRQEPLRCGVSNRDAEKEATKDDEEEHPSMTQLLRVRSRSTLRASDCSEEIVPSHTETVIVVFSQLHAGYRDQNQGMERWAVCSSGDWEESSLHFKQGLTSCTVILLDIAVQSLHSA